MYFGARKSFRRTDALVSPREGYVFSVEVGGAPGGVSSRQFARGIASASLFIPVGRNGDLLLAPHPQCRGRPIPEKLHFRAVFGEGVAGNEEAKHRLLPCQALVLGPWRDVRQRLRG